MGYNFYKPGQPYIPPSVVLKVGDILIIPFGVNVKPSRFEVLKVNKHKTSLRVKVLKDNFMGSQGKAGQYKTGEVIDIGKMIFEQYWGFKVKRNGRLL